MAVADSFTDRAKATVYRMVEPVANPTPLEKFIDIALLVAIFVSVFSFIIGTVPSVEAQYGSLLYVIEVVAVVIFTTEYVLRLWSCVVNPNYRDPVRGRLTYALSPLMLIDMLAILPFYLGFLGSELFVFRLLRLFRLLRILKINRYSAAMTAIRKALRQKGPELLIAVSMMLTVICIASTLLYFAENPTQPEVFSSIPASMWTAIASLTPIGFAGAIPQTVWGRILIMIIAVFGVGTFALPSGIFAAAFSSQLSEAVVKQPSADGTHRVVAPTMTHCPHCGEALSAETTH